MDAEHLAYDAIRDEGPAGMFLASPHTLEHYRAWLTISPLFRSQAHPTWVKQGAPTAPISGRRGVEEAARRATRIRASTTPSTRS